MSQPRPGAVVAYKLPTGTPNAGQFRPAILLRYLDPPAQPTARADLRVFQLAGDNLATDAVGNTTAVPRDQNSPRANGTWFDP